MRALIATSFTLLSLSLPAQAATTSPPCAGTEFRQLDFWLGNWNAVWKGGKGSNHITKSYGGCVIEEHFDGRPGQTLMGHSVSIYYAPAKAWRQNWVDNEGSYFDLRGGPGEKGDFVLTTLPRENNVHANRMVFTDIKPESFTWRWQGTTDGKTWVDSWVIYYTRMKG